MLQKHRQLWKGILTVLVVILYPFLLYTNFGYQMWGHPLCPLLKSSHVPQQ